MKITILVLMMGVTGCADAVAQGGQDAQTDVPWSANTGRWLEGDCVETERQVLVTLGDGSTGTTMESVWRVVFTMPGLDPRQPPSARAVLCDPQPPSWCDKDICARSVDYADEAGACYAGSVVFVNEGIKVACDLQRIARNISIGDVTVTTYSGYFKTVRLWVD